MADHRTLVVTSCSRAASVNTRVRAARVSSLQTFGGASHLPMIQRLNEKTLQVLSTATLMHVMDKPISTINHLQNINDENDIMTRIGSS